MEKNKKEHDLIVIPSMCMSVWIAVTPLLLVFAAPDLARLFAEFASLPQKRTMPSALT